MRIAVGRDMEAAEIDRILLERAQKRLERSYKTSGVPLKADPAHVFTLVEAYKICQEELAKDFPDYDRYAEARLLIEELEKPAEERPAPPAPHGRVFNVLLSIVALMGLAGMLAFVLLPPGTINASMLAIFAMMMGMRTILRYPQCALYALVVAAAGFGLIQMTKDTNSRAQELRTAQRATQQRLITMRRTIEDRQAMLLAELQAYVKGK